MAIVYNVNNTATQVLAAKQVKENIFVNLLHHNGKGVTQQEETNVSTLRMLKVKPNLADARTIGATANGGFFNGSDAQITEVSEYDLNLLYIYDRCADIPEAQQDMCPANLFDNTTKNIGGRIATEINASTIAHQLVASLGVSNHAVLLDSVNGNAYEAIQAASTKLDDGDADNFIQAFPFDEREIIMRPQFRSKLMSDKGVLLGGSNYAQSMIAKGVVSPDANKDFGNMYVGEIDMIPCHIAPSAIWTRAGEWVGETTKFDDVSAIVCAASATDRGISTLDYIKAIDSPNGAGKRLQPKTRWGINVCYAKGIAPIIAAGELAPDVAGVTITAPGSRA
jgi:hypothetical protein